MPKEPQALPKPKTQDKPRVAEPQTNIVSKIMKHKNKFRAGLGFKQARQAGEEANVRFNQTLSRKKIVQGTKGEKGRVKDEDELMEAQESAGPAESGSRNVNFVDEVDEEVSLSQLAAKQKSAYSDPRRLFLEEIKRQQGLPAGPGAGERRGEA